MIRFGRSCLLVSFCAILSIAVSGELPKEPWQYARLFDAVAAGRKDVVSSALDSGTDPNLVSPYWGSLLKYAAAKGHLEIVRLLLAKGADPKADGNKALLLVPIEHEKMDIVRTLVEAGARVRRPGDRCSWDDPIATATATSNAEIVSYLLKHGGDPNGAFAVTNESALEIAAAKGDIDIMRMLVQAGASINYRDWNGMSALMQACSHNRTAAVRYLIERGADVSYKDEYGQTAEDFATRSHSKDKKELEALCGGKLGGN